MSNFEDKPKMTENDFKLVSVNLPLNLCIHLGLDVVDEEIKYWEENTEYLDVDGVWKHDSSAVRYVSVLSECKNHILETLRKEGNDVG